MKVTGEGFLSRSGLEVAQKIISTNLNAFNALERTILEFRSYISQQDVPEIQDTEEDRQKVISLVLAVRMLEVSEAALRVRRHGMSNEASSLFRVFLDVFFILCNICTVMRDS